MSPKIWLVCGALLGGSSVLVGAYGAHGLEKRLQADLDKAPAANGEAAPSLATLLKSYDIAVRYQMIHSFALLVVGILAVIAPGRWWTLSGICYLLGILVFSGGLYGLVFTRDASLGTWVPWGGLGFVAGWLLLALGCASASLTSATSAGRN